MDSSKLFSRSPVDYGRSVLRSTRNLDNVSIAGFVVLAQLFVLVSAPHLWADEWITDLVLYYFIMLGFSFAVLGADNPLYKITVSDGIIQYVTAFVVGLFFFDYFVSVPGMANYGGFESLVSLVIAQSFVVALCEEMMFRGALPKTFQKSNIGYGTSRLLSITAFALFHGWAYSWDWFSIVAAFCFGLLMQYFWDAGLVNNRKAGFPLVAVGLHAAWNTVILSGLGGI